MHTDEFLISIWNNRHIKPRFQSDFHTTNIVENFQLIILSASKYQILIRNNIEIHFLLEL